MLAMQLQTTSNKCYNLLRQIFKLPLQASISRLMKKLDINEGIHSNILATLTNEARQYRKLHQTKLVLAFDEMTLQQRVSYNKGKDSIDGIVQGSDKAKKYSVATHAGVLMIRGLTTKLKLPIGYHFSSGPIPSTTLAAILVDAITKINATGFSIVAVVMDQGTNNIAAIKQLTDTNKITVARNSAFLFYDTPHLLKNTRNNFKANGFANNNGHIISWTYIERLQQYNESQELKICPRLTESHINIPTFKEMDVKRATQVFIDKDNGITQ